MVGLLVEKTYLWRYRSKQEEMQPMVLNVHGRGNQERTLYWVACGWHGWRMLHIVLQRSHYVSFIFTKQKEVRSQSRLHSRGETVTDLSFVLFLVLFLLRCSLSTGWSKLFLKPGPPGSGTYALNYMHATPWPQQLLGSVSCLLGCRRGYRKKEGQVGSYKVLHFRAVFPSPGISL